MGKIKIAITLDEYSVSKLDELVKNRLFQSRSQAIQEAVNEKLQSLKWSLIAKESDNLEADFWKRISDTHHVSVPCPSDNNNENKTNQDDNTIPSCPAEESDDLEAKFWKRILGANPF